MILIVMAVIGRLLVWTLQTSGPSRRIWKLNALLTEFGECDFCVGCWVYGLLAWAFDVNLLAPVYIPVFSEIATGIAFAFVAHLAALGWKSRWGFEVLE